ncbi:MAG: hypothetical protein ACJATA_001917 [Sphingobacteriales bacterium]|jgi:hypothetical protein
MINNSSNFRNFVLGLMAVNVFATFPSMMKTQTFYPDFLHSFSYFTMILPYISLAGTVLFVFLRKPGFFEIFIKNESLYLKTNPFQEQSLIIHPEGYIGHKFQDKFRGLSKSVCFFRENKSGILTSPPYSVSLFSKSKRKSLVVLLDNYQKKYGQPLAKGL